MGNPLDELDGEVEALRAAMASEINSRPRGRAELEKSFGRVWDTAQLEAEFEVRGFAAPFVVAMRRSDGALGALVFQHEPRFYFDFVEA